MILMMQPVARRIMVVFMAPTAWNIFSMAICSRHPKETHRTTYVYWHAISKVSPSLVKSCRKGRVTSRPKPTNKMQWSTVRAIPMVAARSAFSLDAYKRQSKARAPCSNTRNISLPWAFSAPISS